MAGTNGILRAPAVKANVPPPINYRVSLKFSKVIVQGLCLFFFQLVQKSESSLSSGSLKAAHWWHSTSGPSTTICLPSLLFKHLIFITFPPCHLHTTQIPRRRNLKNRSECSITVRINGFITLSSKLISKSGINTTNVLILHLWQEKTNLHYPSKQK